MSFKLNQKDPNRRALILARRKGRKGIDLDSLELDKYHGYIMPTSNIRRGKQDGTPMKQSRRNAMVRHLGLRVGAGDMTTDEAQPMIMPIMAGGVQRKDVYNGLTNRQCRQIIEVKRLEELENGSNP